MDTIEQTLAVATEHHRAGRTTEAERLYREVLAASPGHPDALHLLGVVALQGGRAAEAVDLIGQAVAGDPTSALLHANLGHALHATGRNRDAALSFARALTLLTNQGEGWGNVSALAGLIRRYDDETRRAAAAEVDAGYAMGDVMRRHSLLFLLDGDIAHYESLTAPSWKIRCASPCRRSITPSGAWRCSSSRGPRALAMPARFTPEASRTITA